MNRHNRLSILQYNVRKLRDMVMTSLLRDPGTNDFDIIAIQEPWKSPCTATTYYLAKPCYLVGDTEGIVRVCFFIENKIDQTR